jgi:nitrate reductase gamma subunit
MELMPYVVSYIGLGIFAVAVVARFLMWRRMPLHVRWELYPVAHEGKRARYGGSYLEEVDWWKKPREKSLVGEVRAMAAEILFLVALREHNRKLWVRSFPFHFGLYLVIGASLLMGADGLLGAISPALANPDQGLGLLCRYASMGCGVAGLGLGLLGALGLIERRLSDPELRDASTGADYFNLLFFVVAFGVALASFALVDRDFRRTFALTQNLVTFNMVALQGEGLQVLLPSAAAVLLGVLVAYIPLTHMSHFVGKFFAYHAIRWNDEPNLRGGHQEPAIAALLQKKITWAAPHIDSGDGKKSWAEAATEEVKR